MAIATAGAATIITIGSRTAAETMPRTAGRVSAISRDDKSTTGSSAQPDMLHIELSLTPAINATGTGSRRVEQNATAANRRSGSAGLSVSMIAARLGRAAASAIRTGNET